MIINPLKVGWEWHSLVCVSLVQNNVTMIIDDLISTVLWQLFVLVFDSGV
jgi:hypothetical protein